MRGDRREEMMAKILLVDDDPLLTDSLGFMLKQEGYAVLIASTGADAIEMAQDDEPDLVLLDVSLPDLSGVEVCRRLRSASSTQIIMLTARRQESDKIVGLDAGADDYITKPFATGELLARVRAGLRRRQRGISEGQPIEIGGLVVDVLAHRVTVDGREIDLSAREFALLRVLAESAGRVVTRRKLFGTVWGPDFYGDERALDVYIRQLRKKIEPDPDRPTYIGTIRRVGYRLATPGDAS
jgi:two-component system, OmpR family, response regulator RegX3